MEAFINTIPLFLLVFIRVLSFIMVVPIFSYATVPAIFKIGLAFFLANIMVFTIDVAQPITFEGLYLLLILKELLVGVSIGLIAYILISAIQTAGGLIDFQIGFALANVVDPQTGAQSPIMGQYLYMFALLFLLSVDGHHLLIDGIYYSYQFIPIDQPFLAFGEENTIQMIAEVFSAMFLIAFQMSIPVIACLFLVDLALGIVARTVPQMNIFVVGLPVKILVGFILIFVIIGVMIVSVRSLFDLLLHAMRDFMTLLGQPLP
ncbi:flagellar biosynthetic protein FliR [Pallidibacillus pasinlerensis]|uniref:Flagellar biosynthetic protein FliR n=1 Tax=Pallidibacillus pasinlerensis TaxID=2703818 RepID=A0ABX0A114_9BACI|nr:flagellar biosynthetic protein FliR [Pallidibacillus pasinlerensis]NCU16517.1 flagellar type III secretion system protein FliR [Pallidibacillus pasinlerensis]